jgi:uncharacterized membrane protein YgaE (UPF0421/DUF939 family)
LERILEALREIYPLNEKERFVNKEERWEAALKSLKDIKVDMDDLAAFRKNFISFLITTGYQVGDMPEERRQKWVKDLAAQFTHSSNANKNFKGNKEFQKDLDKLLLADQGLSITPR